MKIQLSLLLICSIHSCITGCCNRNSVSVKDSIADRAVIYYEPNTMPWGLLRIVDISVSDYLQDSDKLNKIVITNKDSLQYILHCLANVHLDTMTTNNYVDTAIAMLLYSENCIDTLSIDGFPQGQIQYNNKVFQDSLFIYYIIDIIRSRDTIWNNKAKPYYYNETHNPLPKTLLDR